MAILSLQHVKTTKAAFDALTANGGPGYTKNTVYFVANPDSADLVDIYISSNSDSNVTVRRVFNEADVASSISSQLATLTDTYVVADISARDGLSLPTGKFSYVYVTDATGDSTVKSGSALYLYNPSTKTFTKISEQESMDVVLTWDAIQNKPLVGATVTDPAW
jgi:hypothetical protein